MAFRTICTFIALAVYQLTFAQTRIVTAGSSASEIVCALGLCDQIVGTDRMSLYPEKLKTLPSIGYRSGINAEGIFSLNPDLIIAEKEYVKDDVLAQLQAANFKVIALSPEQSIENAKIKITTIAAALSKVNEGKFLIRKINDQLSKLAKKITADPRRPTVLCVYARGAGNMMIAGKNTSFGLLSIAGANNALPLVDGYKPLNSESLIQANPDYILFLSSGLESIGGIEGALKLQGVEQTTAGKKKQIIHMDGVLLTGWGPRVAIAADTLFDLTHPAAK